MTTTIKRSKKNLLKKGNELINRVNVKTTKMCKIKTWNENKR
jgi:hypothetical protein